MKKFIFILFFYSCTLLSVTAQESVKDSILPKTLSEVIIISKKSNLTDKQVKLLTTIDDYLQQSGKVEMIKRGAYAWEPLINSMSTERTLITIDGMRIFGACTDKMDPITSYVEVSNLSSATIKSGQQGSCHGSTIGGAIDLQRNRSGFENHGWNGGINTGFETNSNQKILGTFLNHSTKKFYLDSDFTIRTAGNYDAGKHQEVLFSQFHKYNISATSGFRFKENKLIEGSIIYDKATNVGYPALPMDVSLAEAVISSLKYDYVPKSSLLTKWENKIYYNTITHRMDDTKRPVVPVHMDMPGWSATSGFYSKLNGNHNAHHFSADLNSFYNRSIANMTMYPTNPTEKVMFMYTWPDVRTFYMGLFLEDSIVMNCHSSLKFTASIANHKNDVASELGLESLRIFYPNTSKSKSRVLKSFSAAYFVDENGFSYSLGIGYGDRAPSVSEGYGFYLFNSFDRYDYIGSPNLKNENSLEANTSVGYKTEKMTAKISASYFHISNYIVAKPDAILIPMTIGASGVKIYTALDYATIFNSDLSLEIQLTEKIKWTGKLVYSFGEDNNQSNLPFISPLRYVSAFRFQKNKLNTEIEVIGNAVHTQFSSFYGEDRTPSFAILNASWGYNFFLNKNKCSAKAGVENILDSYYSTFSDWNTIPRKGRNFFLNLSFGF